MAGNTTQKVIIAREATAGTAITSGFTVWRGDGGMIEDERVVTIVDEKIGVSAPTTRNYTPQLGAKLDMAATPATFEQVNHLIEAGIKTTTGSQDGAGSDYIYTYTTSNTSEDTRKTYTIETGDTTAQRVGEYGFVEQFKTTWDSVSAMMMSATWKFRQSQNLAGGFDTSTIPDPVEEILGGKLSFYSDDAATSAFPATTQISGTLLKGDLTFDTGVTPKYISDDGVLYWNYPYVNNKNFKVTGSVTLEHDAAGIALIADFEANTAKIFRFEFTGSAVATPGTTYSNKKFIIDMVVVITKVSSLADEDGNGVFTLEFQSGYDVGETEHLQFILVNELSAVPG